MQKGILTIVLILTVTLVWSQGFWLQPKKFKYALGEDIHIGFLTGENFEGELWDIKKNRIEKIELHHLVKVIDLIKQLKPDEKDKLKLKFTEAGTHLLSLQSENILKEWEAEKFNDYLKDEELDNIIDIRTKTSSLNKPSNEFSSCFIKLLLQSGDKTDDTFKKKIGQRLEIIPTQNPCNLKSGDYLQCLILFDGKPALHQLVKVWNKIGNTSFRQNAYTENDGTVKFPISSKGPWMVTTTKMIESGKPGADWQSFKGNLIFGIE